MLTSARGRSSAVARFTLAGWRRAASVFAVAAALGAVAAIPVTAQAADELGEIDDTWSCSVPAGATWDLTEFRLPCSPNAINDRQSFHLRKPVDNLLGCSVPAGFTWDQDFLLMHRCSMYGETPTYRLRKPTDGLFACSVPNGFTYDQVAFSTSCTADGPGLKYHLRDPMPVTISASQAVVERDPPMTGRVTIMWTARAPVRVYVSVDGGAETLFAPAAATGAKFAEISSPHTYVFRVYGQGNRAHVFATTTVKGVRRELSSITPSAARRPDGKIDVFVRGTDGEADMSTLASSGRVMTPWTSLSAKALGAPSGSWTADGRTLDVFAVFTDRRVHHRRYVVGTGWSAWQTLPGAEVASRTVGVARFSGGLSLFARGIDSQAYWTTYSNAGATAGWESLGVLTVGAPSAAWTADGRRLEVFYVGNDYGVYRRQRLDGSWLSPQALSDGGFTAGADTVTVASRRDIERTLFVRGADGYIWRRARSPEGPRLYPWQHFPIDRRAQGSPAASWTVDGNWLDLESVDMDNRIARIQRMPSGWRDWYNSQVASATAGLADNDTQRHVLVRGNDGNARSGELPRSGAPLPWQSMDKPVADAAPASAWTKNMSTRVEVAVGTDRRVFWRRSIAGGFTAWDPVRDAPLASAAPSIDGYADRVTIAFRDMENRPVVGSMKLDGTLVRPFQRIGPPVLGSPAVSWADNNRRLDAVVVGGDGRIYRRPWARGFGWGMWRLVPGTMTSADGTIAVTGYRDPSNGTRRISIFVRGTDGIGRMMTMTRSGRPTTPWTPLGKEVLGAPSGSWSSDGRTLTVAAVGADYLLWHRRWTNAVWSSWAVLGTNAASAPFYVLPTSQPPAFTVAGARAGSTGGSAGSGTGGSGASAIASLLGDEDVTPRPAATSLAGALSAMAAPPQPSGRFPQAPSGSLP